MEQYDVCAAIQRKHLELYWIQKYDKHKQAQETVTLQ